MIPAFPEFKNISVDDREAVESHTYKYPPYSDFNFTSLGAVRGKPFGADVWAIKMIKKFGLEATVRATGRPKKGT